MGWGSPVRVRRLCWLFCFFFLPRVFFCDDFCVTWGSQKETLTHNSTPIPLNFSAVSIYLVYICGGRKKAYSGIVFSKDCTRKLRTWYRMNDNIVDVDIASKNNYLPDFFPDDVHTGRPTVGVGNRNRFDGVLSKNPSRRNAGTTRWPHYRFSILLYISFMFFYMPGIDGCS